VSFHIPARSHSLPLLPGKVGLVTGIANERSIAYLKAEYRMDRNYLKGYEGDRSNPVLAAAGYNFGLLLRWLAALLRALIRAIDLRALRQTPRSQMFATAPERIEK